jgi:hypothetical protein
MNAISKLECEVNALSVDEIFTAYETFGFIYPEKKTELHPYIKTIRANWEKALSAGEEIFVLITHKEPAKKAFASFCLWKNTLSSYFAQHIVSAGNPISSRAVLLGGIGKGAEDELSLTNFFRPTNKWTMKCSGKQYEIQGPQFCHLQKLCYLKVHLEHIYKVPSEDIEILSCTSKHSEIISAFATEIKGAVYAKSESLDDDDLELTHLNKIYNKFGLSIGRKIYLAFQKGKTTPAALLIANHAPLGFNLSFLENRCEIFLCPGLSETIRTAIINTLLKEAFIFYQDFEPGYIPVLCDDGVSGLLISQGAYFLREYMQCMHLKDGLPAFYKSNEMLFQKTYQRFLKQDKVMIG